MALASAGIFAALHFTNLFTSTQGLAMLLEVLYTFAFGICMYLILRVTRTLIAPMLVHASTDPSGLPARHVPVVGERAGTPAYAEHIHRDRDGLRPSYPTHRQRTAPR